MALALMKEQAQALMSVLVLAMMLVQMQVLM